MGLPQYDPALRADEPLTPDDVTDDVLDGLQYSTAATERAIFNAAVAPARPPVSVTGFHRAGNERQVVQRRLTNDASDAEIFDEVMR